MYNPTTHYRFTLIAEGDENLKNNIIYPVKLHRDVNTKMKSNIYEKIHIAQCKYNDGFFKCDVERVYPDRDTYYLDLTSSDDTVQWTNPGTHIIIIVFIIANTIKQIINILWNSAVIFLIPMKRL